jgi:hypothetical protein
MDKNLSWTSSLGDAYYNQQQNVMDAVQVMRRRAQSAGDLKTTPQQTVATQDSNISIEPADPNEVYVPAYDPWSVYGDPIMAWPGWYPYPGIWFGGPYLSFGMGFGIGWYGGFGWGWNNWGFNWRGGYGMYGGSRYYSRSNTFYNRSNYYRGGGERGVARNVQRGSSGARGGAGARNEGNRSGGGNTGGLSMEIPRRPGDTLSPADRAAPARAPSVATGKADRQEAFRRAETPAWAGECVAAAVDFVEVEVEAGLAAVVAADVTNQNVVMFLVDCKTCKWRKDICGEQTSIPANFIGQIFLN